MVSLLFHRFMLVRGVRRRFEDLKICGLIDDEVFDFPVVGIEDPDYFDIVSGRLRELLCSLDVEVFS